VLQWTLCGRYCAAGGQCCCSLNAVRCNYHQLKLRNTNTGQLWQMKFSLVWIGKRCVGWIEGNLSRLGILDFKQTGMNGGILANTRKMQFHENSFTIFLVVTFSLADRKEKEQSIMYQVLFSTPPQLSHSKCMFLLIAFHKETQCLSHSACIFTVQILYKL